MTWAAGQEKKRYRKIKGGERKKKKRMSERMNKKNARQEAVTYKKYLDKVSPHIKPSLILVIYSWADDDDDIVFSEVDMAAHALHIHPLSIYLFHFFAHMLMDYACMLFFLNPPIKPSILFPITRMYMLTLLLTMYLFGCAWENTLYVNETTCMVDQTFLQQCQDIWQ